MPDNSQLLQQARALGESLAAHTVVRAYYAAQQTVNNDDAARKLVQEHHTHAQRVQQLEAEGKPIEVADKHRLRELEQQMAANDALKQLMRHQADYVGLMSQVNRAIDEPLQRLTQPEQSA